MPFKGSWTEQYERNNKLKKNILKFFLNFAELFVTCASSNPCDSTFQCDSAHPMKMWSRNFQLFCKTKKRNQREKSGNISWQIVLGFVAEKNVWNVLNSSKILPPPPGCRHVSRPTRHIFYWSDQNKKITHFCVCVSVL